MFAPFDSLEDSARLWIYQSSRKLTTAELSTISETLLSFTQQWVAHGNPLKTSFKIFHEQFIVLAADEDFNEASGCSIDASARVIKQIDQEFKLDLFDRTKVGFWIENEVRILSLNTLQKAFSEGIWNADSLVFNNVIATKAELENSWIISANQTWLKRYLRNIGV